MLCHHLLPVLCFHIYHTRDCFCNVCPYVVHAMLGSITQHCQRPGLLLCSSVWLDKGKFREKEKRDWIQTKLCTGQNFMQGREKQSVVHRNDVSISTFPYQKCNMLAFIKRNDNVKCLLYDSEPILWLEVQVLERDKPKWDAWSCSFWSLDCRLLTNCLAPNFSSVSLGGRGG